MKWSTHILLWTLSLGRWTKSRSRVLCTAEWFPSVTYVRLGLCAEETKSKPVCICQHRSQLLLAGQTVLPFAAHDSTIETFVQENESLLSSTKCTHKCVSSSKKTTTTQLACMLAVNASIEMHSRLSRSKKATNFRSFNTSTVPLANISVALTLVLWFFCQTHKMSMTK